MSQLSVIHPPEWAPTKGYSAGVRGDGGAQLFVAGQIGWDAQQRFTTDDFIEQFTLALDNVLSVVSAAGGRPDQIAEMTIYVTDLDAYRQRARELGPVWRERLGRHYPAMALVGFLFLNLEMMAMEIEQVGAAAMFMRAPPARARAYV